MNIAVLAGGYSPERDVSLTSGSLIANALIDEGHNVCLADVYLGVDEALMNEKTPFNKEKKAVYKVKNAIPDLKALKEQSGNGEALIGRGIIELCRAADVVFLALHGAMGENGQLQATLDNYGIKYTGSGYVGSLLAMDKDISKKMFVGAGVRTPEWVYVSAKRADASEIEKKIGYPCVVKPCSCGSSVGISIVDNREELDDAGIVAILAKQVKMRKDALADFEKAGRTDLVESYNAEIEILSRYLPEQLSEEKLREIVAEVAAGLGIEGGKQNMGKLMGPVMAKVKGLADGNAVKKVVQEFLG
jgi:D-alanine--D-alanine ligase